MKKEAGVLKYWELKDGGRQVSGNLYNDKQKRWGEGERVTTSRIVKITVETLNSIYTLEPVE